eukprot:scaffold5084_cov385-Prasinococcus_capsulatus_cf.AAC.4
MQELLVEDELGSMEVPLLVTPPLTELPQVPVDLHGHVLVAKLLYSFHYLLHSINRASADLHLHLAPWSQLLHTIDQCCQGVAASARTVAWPASCTPPGQARERTGRPPGAASSMMQHFLSL